MTHLSLNFLVQARFDLQKDKKLRSQTYLEPLGNDAVRGRLLRRAICRYEIEEAKTGILGCQCQDG
jgi:hypothetical protein